MQARSGGHTKVVAYLEAAKEKMLREGRLLQSEVAVLDDHPRAAADLASRKRIEQRLERIASFSGDVVSLFTAPTVSHNF